MPIKTQSGRAEKTENSLTITFPQPFTGTPVVVITGHWDGGPSGVAHPDILQDIDNDNFRVFSDNKTPAGGAKYFINWMAIGNVS
jgi:hypothetical protein